jgi:hypothetical protein
VLHSVKQWARGPFAAQTQPSDDHPDPAHIVADEGIIALTRLQGRGRESGPTVVADVGVIFECDRGTIKRMVFCDREC